MAPTTDRPALHPVMTLLDVPTSRTNAAPARWTEMIQTGMIEAE